MIHAHSLGRAAHYYGERTALASGAGRPTFRELHDRVAGIAAALGRHGFRAGDRLAMLLPNEHDYLELVYACAWLGVIAVPVNIRLSGTEIDHLIADASPRGLIRHSSLPAPTVTLPWQLVLDQEPLDAQIDCHPEAIYDPEAILALARGQLTELTAGQARSERLRSMGSAETFQVQQASARSPTDRRQTSVHGISTGAEHD